jgi:hypothetical protein
MGLELGHDELVGMFENMLEMTTVESMLAALTTVLQKKEQYARTSWPDQSDTFEYYTRQAAILVELLGKSSDLGKELAAKAEAEREARLREAVAERARQDEIYLKRNAQAAVDAWQDDTGSIAILKTEGPKYFFRLQIEETKNAGPTLFASFVDMTFWTQNSTSDKNGIGTLGDILEHFKCVKHPNLTSTYMITYPAHQIHLDKFRDLFLSIGFTENLNI